MNVSLTPELENLVNQKVKTGMYNSTSEVVREALRLLEEKDRIKEMRLEELRAEIQKGIDDIHDHVYRPALPANRSSAAKSRKRPIATMTLRSQFICVHPFHAVRIASVLPSIGFSNMIAFRG